MSRLAFRLTAAVAAAGAVLHANSVFVVPSFTGATTVTGTVYANTPLALAGNFNASTDTYAVFTRTGATPAATKYYVISRSTQASIVVLNSNYQPARDAINLGQQITAAALSPDGRRLVVVAGNLRVFETENDSEIQFNFIDVGQRPAAMAFSQDSRFVFIVSVLTQSLYVVNLSTGSPVPAGTIQGIEFTSTAEDTFLTTCANGMVYLSAERRIIEIDPNRVNPASNPTFDRNFFRREFVFNNTKLGAVQCTPDGTRALVINQRATNGTTLYFLNLTFNGPGNFVGLTTTDLGGSQINKLAIAGLSRAYGITTTGSTLRERIIDFAIPPVPALGEQLALPTGAGDPQFANLGPIQIVDSVAFSNEYPSALRAVVHAPLNRLSAAASNTIYDMNYAGNPAMIAEFRLNFLPGFTTLVPVSGTNPPDPIGGVVPLNTLQPVIRPGARMLPVGVKVISSTGRPIQFSQVTFSPGQGSPTFEGPATVTTNSEGLAYVTIVAPGVPGDFTFLATPQNGPSVSFRFTVVAPDGTGGGGQQGGPSIEIISGDGQVVTEGNRSNLEYVVQVLSSPGRPAANVPVTWNITEGGTRWDDGAFTDVLERRVTNTDANGFARNTLRAAGVVGFGNSILSSKGTVSATINNTTITQNLCATTYLAFDLNSGNPSPPPSTIFMVPESGIFNVRGKTGTTLLNALRIVFTSSSGSQLGSPIPCVGLSVTSENRDPAVGPVASCSPRPVPLSGADGIVACDLKLSGKAGRTIGKISLGGFSEQVMQITVDPGDPSNLKAIAGDQQAADPNTNPNPLVVQLDDGGGTFLPNVTLRWEVVSGSAILANQNTVTDANGRSQNNIRLGLVPGTVTIRVTALGGNNPQAVFTLTIRATVAALVKVSGDTQTAFINTSFASPIIVQVNDNRNQPVPNQQVTFSIAGGPATFVTGGTQTTVTTDNLGRAAANIRAGATAGPVIVNAVVAGFNQTATFNLTVQTPGPRVTATDFFNAASNEQGAVSPGGLFNMTGSGYATELRGCVQGQTAIGPYPTRLANVEVQFGSFLAPLLAVCNQNGQETVTLQVPFEVQPGTTDVTVRSGNTQTVITGVRVVALQPGIFETTDGQGRRYAVAQKVSDNTFITPENPGRWGDVIKVLITGGGQTTPRANTGVPGVADQRMMVEPIVGLNDSGVRLVRAVYQQGNIGVYEIHLEIPDGTPTGSNRPIGVILPAPGGGFVYPENAPVIAIATR